MKIFRQVKAKFTLRKKKKPSEHVVMSPMITQVVEEAKEEAAGMEASSMLSDMEVTQKTNEPTYMKSVPPPPLSNGSPTSHSELDVMNTTNRQIASVKKLKRYSTALMDDGKSQLMGGDGATAAGSPTSHFELDAINATHDNLDYVSLLKQKSYSTALMDEDKSISSEESSTRRNLERSFVREDDGMSVVSRCSTVSDAVSCAGFTCASDVVSTQQNMNGEAEDNGLLAAPVAGSTHDNDKADEAPNCVDNILSPITSASDFMFGQMKWAFPNAVEDMDEMMSNDLHHLIFPCDGNGEGREVSIALTQTEEEERDSRGVGYVQEEEVELVLDICLNKQGGRRSRSDKGEVDEEVKDVQLVKGVQRLEDVRLSFEAQLENAAYCPRKGLVRKVGKLPQLSKDEVLIRVDATTISNRDCLERLRRDKNKELFEELWVPGHEIVGRVVRAGTKSKSLSGKLVAALLPSGGGCSQYVRIKTKDAIELPKDASSNEVVPLLSTYMAAYQCLESVIEAFLKVDGGGDDGSVSMVSMSTGGSPLAGKNVMIYGAGNPAGLALVDLARNAGATVYVVSSRAHLSTMRDLGAKSWYGLNQRTVWESKWRGAIDVVIDTVGDSHNHPSFFKVMKTRGRFARVNTTSCGQKYVAQKEKKAQWQWFSGYKELSRYEQRVFNDKTIDDYDIFHSIKKDKDLFEEDLDHLFQLLQARNIKPRIVSRVGFDGLEGEWEKILAGGTSGVVMVLPGQTMM